MVKRLVKRSIVNAEAKGVHREQ